MAYSMSDLLQLVVSEGSSDLHIRVGCPPVISPRSRLGPNGRIHSFFCPNGVILRPLHRSREVTVCDSTKRMDGIPIAASLMSV